MPPNMRGGKAFKKSKKAPQTETVGRFTEKEEGQEYARVLRKLGERRVLCFCNDGKERVCKIRSLLCWGPRRQWIDVGDIVLICFREFEAGDSDTEIATGDGSDMAPTAAAVTLASGRKEIADLVLKYPVQHANRIRKLPNIHRCLFLGSSATTGAGATGTADDDIFEHAVDDEITGPTGPTGPGEDSDVDIDAI